MTNSTCGFQAPIDFLQFGFTFDLDAKVIEARFASARRDCEVHARIIEHPLA